MLRALRYLDSLADDLEKHELYGWIRSSRHEDPRRHLDCFIPILSFVITFPFYNMQYLAYPSRMEPNGRWSGEADDGRPRLLRDLINEHAREDATHARLFLEDLRRLKLADVWDIDRASTLLWTLWVSPMLDAAQGVTSRRVGAIVDPEAEWPPYRYLHIEQLERDGHLLFSAAADKAKAITSRAGATPVYFGAYHLERESGHVGSVELENVTLTGDQDAVAGRTICTKHRLSLQMNDLMHDFAISAERNGSAGRMLASEQQARLATVRERIAACEADNIPLPNWSIDPDEFVTANQIERSGKPLAQQELLSAWRDHHDEFICHPFVTAFRDVRGAETGFALRCAALLFANRICALHAFYRYDCALDRADPGTAGETVRFVAENLATEAQLFFHDWEVLHMDECIRWDTPTLLEWLFFDPTYGRPEAEALHEFRSEALRSGGDPIVKYWAIMSIQFMSRAFFAASTPLADRFERTHPELPSLVYFMGTHHLLYRDASEDISCSIDPTTLLDLPISEGQRRYILDMMDTFASLGRGQFDNLARALTTDQLTFEFLR